MPYDLINSSSRLRCGVATTAGLLVAFTGSAIASTLIYALFKPLGESYTLTTLHSSHKITLLVSGSLLFPLTWVMAVYVAYRCLICRNQPYLFANQKQNLIVEEERGKLIHTINKCVTANEEIHKFNALIEKIEVDVFGNYQKKYIHVSLYDAIQTLKNTLMQCVETPSPSLIIAVRHAIHDLKKFPEEDSHISDLITLAEKNVSPSDFILAIDPSEKKYQFQLEEGREYLHLAAKIRVIQELVRSLKEAAQQFLPTIYDQIIYNLKDIEKFNILDTNLGLFISLSRELIPSSSVVII